MAFRANEEEKQGRDRAYAKLLGPSVEAAVRERSRDALDEIIERWGPVVETYPHWHPLVANHEERSPVTTPSASCGYRGLDHTIFLRSGVITCPYGEGKDVFASVEKLSRNPKIADIADIAAEKIAAQLYHPDAHPILITCTWVKGVNNDGTIPTELAVPLLLEREIPCWRWAQVAETWETMAPYILGRPSGSRSSLFVTQETGQKLKDIWNSLIHTGMFGPIHVGSRR